MPEDKTTNISCLCQHGLSANNHQQQLDSHQITWMVTNFCHISHLLTAVLNVNYY